MERKVFRIAAFLASRGVHLSEVLDYEDGLPFSSLLYMNVEIGRLAMQEQKAQVDAMTVALTSLFDKKVLEQYRKGTTEALEATDVLGDKSRRVMRRTAVRSEEQKALDAQRSVAELNKLNKILVGG